MSEIPEKNFGKLKTAAGLPDIWLKAAMLGSLWASVEIILGSFLHNLHIPLAGTFLAALGLILMISGYRLWPEQGLFWRTALITAGMKSISPSAIIFGPMVGIFMEGFLLELFVRLFRGRWPGFIIGGALAVSWSLFQKILVLLMTYGPDFIKLYEQLTLMAARSLQISPEVSLDLVQLIFIIDLGFGALVAVLALRTSRMERKTPSDLIRPATADRSEDFPAVSVTQQYSLLLLVANLLVLLGGLVLLEHIDLLAGGGLVGIYVGLNIARYARSLRRLKRPQLWIQLIAIMALSGLLLGGWENQTAVLNGLLSGVAMSVRALLVIFSFSALSIEIRNPLIMEWFERRGMSIAFEALTLAFEVLPRLIKLVSEQKKLWRHPFKALNGLLGTLELLRQEHADIRTRVLLITGAQGAGKTNLIKAFIGNNDIPGLNPGGFFTEGAWLNGERDHYHIVDLHSNHAELLCERREPVSQIRSGPFNFRETGIHFGCQILSLAGNAAYPVVVVDEIGNLELRGLGWSAPLQQLIDQRQAMIWTVRPALLDRVVAKWRVRYQLLDARDASPADLTKAVQDFLLSKNSQSPE